MPVPDPIDFEKVFSSIPGLYLVFDRDHTVVAASDSYLRATETRREDVVGRRVLEGAGDDLDGVGSAARRDIAASLDRVIEFARPDVMPIRTLGAGYPLRRWRPSNTPVLDSSGRVRWIIHSLEDVTDDDRGIERRPPFAPPSPTRRAIIEELRWANGVLSALPDAMFLKLADHLSPIRIAEGTILIEPLRPLSWIYFPLEGLNAAILYLADGSSSEVAMGGRGGLVGVSILTGAPFEETETRARVAGSALRIRAGVLRDILADDPRMRAQLDWFLSLILTLIGLTSACNARHALDQRLARWLLTASRRIDGARLAVSQDSIASALGVRRSGVSEGLRRFQVAGLVDTGRQRIEILDFVRLESHACDCFRESELARERHAAAFAPQRATPERIHDLIEHWTKIGPPPTAADTR